MIPILYEKNEAGFTSNGLGRLRDCISCIVTEERNGIFECDFEYPVDGANFDLIQCGRVIAVEHDDTGDLQPFDIVSYSKPIDGIVTFHCTHISYRLSGQTVWASSVNSLASALTLFGNVAGTPFTYSADFTSSNYMAAADGVPRTVRQMLGGIEGSVLDSYGGEYEWNKWQVILHRNRGQARDFTIRYGVNLLDYQEDTDYQGTYSSCVPFWVGSDDQGQQVVVRGSRVNSGLPTVSGRNDCVPLDLTEKFESKPTAAQLQTLAATIMSAQQVNLPAQTINVDFVRLQDMSEYAGYAPLLQCRLCDTIKVEFPAYGLSGRFKIVKTVWNVLTERFDEMQLGSLSTTLAQALGIEQGSPEKYNTITNLSMSGDLTVGDDASIVGDLSVGGNASVTGTITSGGKITSGGRIVLPYNTYFVAKDSADAEQGMLFFYNNNEIFGNNSFATQIRGSSISISAPITGLYKVTTEVVSVPATSAHGSQSSATYSITAQSGYHAVGIVGWNCATFRIVPFNAHIISDSSIGAGFVNTTATATSSAYNMTFYILWLKGTSG